MDNVALAHLLYDDALASAEPDLGGKSFTVTDPNPAIQFSDMYQLLSTLTPFRVQIVPAVPLLILAHLIEAYCTVRRDISFVGRMLPAIPHPTSQMQPNTIQIANSHQFANNEEISKPLKEGGLGYKGIYTSMDGMCTQVRGWLDDYGGTSAIDEGSVLTEVKNLTVVSETSRR